MVFHDWNEETVTHSILFDKMQMKCVILHPSHIGKCNTVKYWEKFWKKGALGDFI